MSKTQKRDNDRRELSELWQAIEPAKNEEIARRALGLAEHYLIKAENQARQIQNLERRNQPTRGKWIYGEDEYGIDGYHCDKCGFFVPWDYVHKFINYIEDYNFCPNCGAEMEGEEE